MAEGNKSRAIIWTIVGILVVAAVIFLIVGRKGAGESLAMRKVTVAEVPGFVEKMNRIVEKEEERVAKLRAEYGSTHPDDFVKIDELLQKVRAGVADIQQLSDDAGTSGKADEIRIVMDSAKDVRKKLGKLDRDKRKGGSDE